MWTSAYSVTIWRWILTGPRERDQGAYVEGSATSILSLTLGWIHVQDVQYVPTRVLFILNLIFCLHCTDSKEDMLLLSPFSTPYFCWPTVYLPITVSILHQYSIAWRNNVARFRWNILNEIQKWVVNVLPTSVKALSITGFLSMSLNYGLVTLMNIILRAIECCIWQFREVIYAWQSASGVWYKTS